MPASSVCVLTAWNDEFQELAAISRPGIAAYCAAHGFEWRDRRVARPSTGWLKIDPIIELLEAGDFGHVVWLDSDIVVQQLGRNIVRESGDHDLAMAWHTFADGMLPAHFNAGVMVIRQSDWSRSFFRRIRALQASGAISHPWNEQAAILHLLGHHAAIGAGADEPGNPDRAHVGALDWDWNSIVGLCTGSDPCFHHYAGADPSYRASLMTLDAAAVAADPDAPAERRRIRTEMFGQLRTLNDAALAAGREARAREALHREAMADRDAVVHDRDMLRLQLARLTESYAWKLVRPVRTVEREWRKLRGRSRSGD